MPRKYWKQILSLMILSPLLAEVLSSNLSLAGFLDPLNLVLLVTLGYGIPVLLIRELAVRKKLGVQGLLLLGLAYGVYNEGIIAKTFLLTHDVPLVQFNGYGMLLGIGVPWALLITLWHALFSVLLPILYVYHFFPSASEEPWIGKRTAWVLLVAVLGAGVVNFLSLSNNGQQGSPLQLVALIAAGALLSLLALRASRPVLIQRVENSRKYVWWGVGWFAVSLAIPISVAGAGAPVLFYVAYILALVAGLAVALSRAREVSQGRLLLFGLGAQICIALWMLVTFLVALDPQKVLSSTLFLVLFFYLVFSAEGPYRSALEPPRRQ
jgi:hypothetical protein